MDIIEVINEKIRIFDEILKLSRKQKRMIERDDISKLNVATEQKQKFINQLEKIDKDTDNIVSKIADDATGETKTLIEQLRANIKEVLDIDKENNEVMKLKIGESSSEIKKLNNERRKLNLYRPNVVSSGGTFFDKKK